MDRHSGENDSILDLESNVQELYEQAPCALLSTLPDGTIVRANQTFFDWLGASPEATLGTVRFQSLLTIGSRIYYETHYAPLLQMQGVVAEIALDVRRVDGTTRPVVASARQLKDANGAAWVNRIALFDSADRRSYERELLDSRHRAEENAGRLAVADRQRADFIALLAHELRNPLAPARMALEVIRQDCAGHSVEKMAAILERQIGQMSRLVDDLLDIGRIDQDKLSLQPVVLDLTSVVHHALEVSAPLFDASGVTHEATLPSAPIYVRGDAGRLVQVIGNLLNNAAKFTPRGGTVSVWVDRVGADAAVRVRDTGMGISADQLPRVFEMFMQANAPSGMKSGLGIGLTLAKDLIERHGGRITVTSEGLGRGAEFAIQLPALLEAPVSVSKVTPLKEGSTPVMSRRILVVDDNRDSIEVTTMLLTHAGHDVRSAGDGLAALDEVSRFNPELILLDIGLPGLNGYEVAKQIRSTAAVQPVLVAVTGWGQEDDRKRSQLAGFDAHLVKPVDHEDLLSLIAKLPTA